MKESVFMPVINQDFELHYWSKKYQSHNYSMKPDESAENYSEIEPLFRLHSHDAMEILVILGGGCEFFCEGSTYSLTKGDIVVIPPYAVHQATVKDFDNYERIVSMVSNPLLEEFLSISPAMKESTVDLKTHHSFLIHLPAKNVKEITTIFQELSERKKAKEKEHHSFAVHYLLFQALQIILNTKSDESIIHDESEKDQRLVSIIEYIETHLTDPDLNLNNISNHFHLSKYYFSHYFKNNMNVSFYRYVLLKRLATAVTMIRKNETSIEEIAAKCGFQDYSSFYRLFKKEYNVSPKRLQKGYRS